MDLEYGKRAVFFTRRDCDEMDEASVSGSAELDDNGTIEIERSTTATMLFSGPPESDFLAAF